MQVVGVTTQQEVYVVSRKRKFHMNEILIIEDVMLQEPRGEVIETISYNRLIPMGLDKSIVDHQVIQMLEQIGYDMESEEINLAKVRLYEEVSHPVKTGCSVRLPHFDEVRNILVKTSPEKGMLLGEIRGTDSLSDTLSEDLQDQVMISEHESYRPQKGVPFIFDVYTMHQYPHMGIFGGSGSGKSFGIRVMMEELMKLRIPTVVFDPHYEMDFAHQMAELKDRSPSFQHRFITTQLGQQVGVSFSDLSVRDLVQLLGAAGGALSESMVNVIQMLYKKRDSFHSFSDRLNNLVQALEEGKNLERGLHQSKLKPMEAERIQELLKLANQYGSLPLASVKGVHWRLYRLEKAGLFQQDIRVIEQGLEQRKLVVVQGSNWILQVFATYLIGALYRKRRDFKDATSDKEFFPPFIIVTDEAHNFAPKAIDSPTKGILKEISQEGRKYGVFLILATQRPNLLDETITAQLNTKFIFRTVRGTDIQTLKEETDLTSEEGKRLPYLRSGDAFISSAVLGRTIFTRIRCAYTHCPHLANPFDELQEIASDRDERVVQTISERLPFFDTDLLEVVEKVNKECGFNWKVSRMKQELQRLAEEGVLKLVSTPFATRYDIMKGEKKKN